MKYAVTGATGKFGQTVIKVLVFLNLNKNLAAMFVFKGLIFVFSGFKTVYIYFLYQSKSKKPSAGS